MKDKPINKDNKYYINVSTDSKILEIGTIRIQATILVEGSTTRWMWA